MNVRIVTKFGGAARRRFHAICEKPEGGLLEPPPARNRVKEEDGTNI